MGCLVLGFILEIVGFCFYVDLYSTSVITLIIYDLFLVRYLKEITPYFKKNFQLDGVGWQLDNRRPISKPAPSGDIKMVPLAWAILGRPSPEFFGGAENLDGFGNSCMFELKAPDERFSVIFR